MPTLSATRALSWLLLSAPRDPLPSRRCVVAQLLCASSLVLPRGRCAASDYQTADAAIASQFEAAEAARAAREQRMMAARRGFELKVGALQDARDTEEFVAASDALALEVIRAQAIPEGVVLQTAVARIRARYNLLPKVRYECEGRRDCYNHGAAAEAAYAALLRELRRYARRGAYAQSGGSELPNTPFSF